MSSTKIEIIDGRERRRRWGLDEKLRIVAESDEPDACVREVAARHDVYPSLLHAWRRQVRQGQLVAAPPARFVAVRMAEPAPLASIPSSAVASPRAADTIEILLPDGSRLHVGNAVSLASLRRVMTALCG
jgi:transposase